MWEAAEVAKKKDAKEEVAKRVKETQEAAFGKLSSPSSPPVSPFAAQTSPPSPKSPIHPPELPTRKEKPKAPTKKETAEVDEQQSENIFLAQPHVPFILEQLDEPMPSPRSSPSDKSYEILEVESEDLQIHVLLKSKDDELPASSTHTEVPREPHMPKEKEIEVIEVVDCLPKDTKKGKEIHIEQLPPAAVSTVETTQQPSEWTFDEELLDQKVEEGLQRLNGFGGQLNPDKCHIGEDEVILLGHKISQRGIEVDPAKAKALLELPSPKSIKEVTSFMQKVKYMARFIHLASVLLHPLQKLTQQVEFAWSEDLEEYFKSIKMVLSKLPTLMPPCWDFPFFVSPSVGAKSIGAILLQQDPQSSRMRPVYFTSRVTTNIEKGYSEAELMMLSLIFAVRKFRSYLLTKPFVILTSENLLPWVSSQMTMSPRISKWLMELQSYEYTFKVENSVRAQLVGILTYRLHEKVIKVPNVRPLSPPPPKVLSNAYTLFFDGAFGRATGKAGGGLVLVNPKGEVVIKEQVTLDGSTSNNEAEYDILISGLKICLAQKIRRLMVKGDALLIVKQILGIWACKNERLKTKVTSIRKIFNQFEEVQLYHIPRKENEDADLLAQQAISDQDKAHMVMAAIALKDPQYAGMESLTRVKKCSFITFQGRRMKMQTY
ncbi:hypothetical protein L7F22_040731 [Adiantum nelumboides]|nr:hypothetical protein [Adiantum nelumboides]